MRHINRGAAIREIENVRRSLELFARSLRHLAPMLSAVPHLNGNPKGAGRPRLSSKARASLVLQGRYMGYMRQLKPRQKAQVRKVREAKGVRAAIATMRQLVP